MSALSFYRLRRVNYCQSVTHFIRCQFYRPWSAKHFNKVAEPFIRYWFQVNVSCCSCSFANSSFAFYRRSSASSSASRRQQADGSWGRNDVTKFLWRIADWPFYDRIIHVSSAIRLRHRPQTDLERSAVNSVERNVMLWRHRVTWHANDQSESAWLLSDRNPSIESNASIIGLLVKQ